MSLHKKVLVGQSGGPTAAINASLAGVYAAARARGASVLGMRNGIEGALAGNAVDLDEVLSDPLNLELLRHTPSSYLGSCRLKLKDPDVEPAQFEALFERFDRLGVDVVAYIGGNDSMDTIEKLARFGARTGSDIRFVGVPKTIDNDLVAMDHTPGYGSAAKFVATSVVELSRDLAVYEKKSVVVVEIMGRDAGWLAASASLAGPAGNGGPDIVLLPEAPVDLERFLARVSEVAERQNTVMVAASEGVRGLDGAMLYDEEGVDVDAFGHAASQSGAGRFLSDLIKQRLGFKSRAVELSTLQRCAAHLASATDLQEAETVGAVAIEAALDGQTGVASRILRVGDDPYRAGYGLVPIHEVANRVRAVPAEWIRSDGMGLTQEFQRYGRPLITGEVAAPFVNGVPCHLKLPRR